MRMNLPQLQRLVFLFALGEAAVAAPPISTDDLPGSDPIGRHISYLKEQHGRLTLDAVTAAYKRGDFSPNDHEVLGLGIGSKPVWIRLGVYNHSQRPLQRRISINTPWLDRLDVHFMYDGTRVGTHQMGDLEPFDRRPVHSPYFAVDHVFDPGTTEVFIRAETPDPMLLPIFLMSPEQARTAERQRDYGYGFLYGFLFALLAYNVMLYFGFRESRYLLYSLYLGMFLLLNISYTGHGFEWLWPDRTGWEQWLNPILMLLYGASGLMFALRFLETRVHFPRLRKFVIGYVGVSAGIALLTIASGNREYALLVAFVFVILFTIIMPVLGMAAIKAGQKPARYFLLASMAAMVGASLTSLVVWGFIPYNRWTFHAVEVGMLLDATLLALALGHGLRIGQIEKVRAQQLARLDPLTRLNNRRAFYDATTPIWNVTTRNDRDLSVVLLDLDHFKRINDTYGHTRGDEILVATAKALTKDMRDQDVMARWGGEEFILLLPETDLQEAAAVAERLREKLEAVRVRFGGTELTVTASFGVAQREPHHDSLDALILTADRHLYRAKGAGRNRVSAA